jgi:hypothetical protein
MRSLLFILAIATLVIACEEPFILDSKQAPPNVVIDGLITDQKAYHSVKVAWSTPFYTKGKSPAVNNAVVTVSDDAGNVFPFVHNPSAKADSIGYYRPVTPFAGVIGRTYRLRVEVDGQVYEASDKLSNVIPVDSLGVEIDDDEFSDPEVEGRYYDILVFATEPQNETNYYLFKFYRNDSLLYENDTDIYYSDDELLAENIDGVSGPLYYKLNDKAKVEVYSLSREAYVFYNDLATLLNSDGGMFGPIPSSPRTNLSNGALGLFQVSAVKSRSIVIE